MLDQRQHREVYMCVCMKYEDIASIKGLKTSLIINLHYLVESYGRLL